MKTLKRFISLLCALAMMTLMLPEDIIIPVHAEAPQYIIYFTPDKTEYAVGDIVTYTVSVEVKGDEGFGYISIWVKPFDGFQLLSSSYMDGFDGSVTTESVGKKKYGPVETGVWIIVSSTNQISKIKTVETSTMTGYLSYYGINSPIDRRDIATISYKVTDADCRPEFRFFTGGKKKDDDGEIVDAITLEDSSASGKYYVGVMPNDEEERANYVNRTYLPTLVTVSGCEHSSSVWVGQVDPTCTEAGTMGYWKCADCGAKFSDEACTTPAGDLTIPATGHSYDSEVTTQPTCAMEGVRTYTCTNCSDTYTENIPKTTDHKYADTVIGPTCTDKGYTLHKCTVCGDEYIDEYVDKTAHSYESKVTLEPTCTEKGVRTYTCSRCGDSYSKPIEAKGHNHGAIAYKAPTCTEDGYTVYRCSRCSDTFTTYHIATGHNYEREVTKEPTCTKEGEATFTCTNCGDSYTEPIEPLGADGHKYTSKVTKEATCTVAGIKTYTCSVCGDSYTRPIAALGHDLISTVTKMPTAREEGIRTYTCTRCDYSYTEPIAPTGDDPHEEHDFIGVVTKEPTCTEDGVMTYTCSDCGASYIEPIDAKGHSFKSITTKPTCTKDGFITKKCAKCGYNYISVAAEKTLFTGTHKYDLIAYEASWGVGTDDNIVFWEPGTSWSEITDYDKIMIEATIADPTGADADDFSCMFYDMGNDSWTWNMPGYADFKDGALYFEIDTNDLNPEGDSTIGKCGIQFYVRDADVDDHLTASMTYKLTGIRSDLKAKGHSYEDTVIEPTETKKGYTHHKCSVCGDEYDDNYVAPFKLESYDVILKSPEGSALAAETATVTIGDKTVESADGSFTLPTLADGEYEMTISAPNYVPRTYNIIVSGGKIVGDIKPELHLIGDTTGDGKLNNSDLLAVKSHIKGIKKLTDYDLACANADGDKSNKINNSDLLKMKSHIKAISKLW